MNQTVFVKVSTKDRLPERLGYYFTDYDQLTEFYNKTWWIGKKQVYDVKWWLEEVELPKNVEEKINNHLISSESFEYVMGFDKGAKFIMDIIGDKNDK